MNVCWKKLKNPLNLLQNLGDFFTKVFFLLEYHTFLTQHVGVVVELQ